MCDSSNGSAAAVQRTAASALSACAFAHHSTLSVRICTPEQQLDDVYHVARSAPRLLRCASSTASATAVAAAR
eukprot:8408334-Alexandrium_andersonii.AAC.1